jgi:integrase
VEGPTGPVLRATKTHRTYRVAIDEATMQRLIDHRRRADARARSSGVAVADMAFVFSPACDGSVPWQPNRVTKQFIRHLRRSGVGRFRLHDLRHFMATQMLGHGVAVVTVAQRLGHARASTTLNVYGHCIPGADLDAARLISSLITSQQATSNESPR